MIEEKPGRPERPEVLGLAGGDLSGVVRKLAGAGYGGVPPIVIMEDGDYPPRRGKCTKKNRKTGRHKEVNAVYVGREWVYAHMNKELGYWQQYYDWFHGTEPKGLTR